MDINQIVEQVKGALQETPEKIQEFIADPKGTIEGIVGEGAEGVDMDAIIEQVKGGLGEAGGNIADFAGGIAENVGGAVTGLLDNIFKK